MAKLLILNGPNLNLLGQREQQIYGSKTLQDIINECQQFASTCGFDLDHFQANAEHQLLERIHATLADGTNGLLFNPAAFTHTSVALRDGLLAVKLPFVEVHLSQPQTREPFRHHSYFSDIAIGTIAGFGADGYVLGLQALINHLDSSCDT